VDKAVFRLVTVANVQDLKVWGQSKN